MAPVIALARSEATKAAKFATSASVGKRFSNVAVRARSASMASTVVPTRSAKPLKTSIWKLILGRQKQSTAQTSAALGSFDPTVVRPK
jgi:hypothetical protein